MEKLPNLIKNLSPSLLENVGRKCPQLKEVIEIDIKDIKIFDREYGWEEELLKSVKIDGNEYIVRKSYIEELIDLLNREECQRLSVSGGTLDKIYDCFNKICENRRELMNGMNHNFFRYCYENNTNGNKLFKAMDLKNSVVATMCFYLYHYNFIHNFLILVLFTISFEPLLEVYVFGTRRLSFLVLNVRKEVEAMQLIGSDILETEIISLR